MYNPRLLHVLSGALRVPHPSNGILTSSALNAAPPITRTPTPAAAPLPPLGCTEHIPGGGHVLGSIPSAVRRASAAAVASRISLSSSLTLWGSGSGGGPVVRGGTVGRGGVRGSCRAAESEQGRPDGGIDARSAACDPIAPESLLCREPPICPRARSNSPVRHLPVDVALIRAHNVIHGYEAEGVFHLAGHLVHTLHTGDTGGGILIEEFNGRCISTNIKWTHDFPPAPPQRVTAYPVHTHHCQQQPL